MHIELLAALSVVAMAIDDQNAVAAVPRQPLPSLISYQDYPQQALRNNEQGDVRFRLDIEPDGRVSGCTILASSRSSALDSTTCRIMRSRARFTTNTSGQARSYETTVAWRLGQGRNPTPRLNAMTEVWIACVGGEAAKRTITAIPAGEITAAARSACEAVEPLLTAERIRAGVPESAIEALNKQLETNIVAKVNAVRKTLETAAPPR